VISQGGSAAILPVLFLREEVRLVRSIQCHSTETLLFKRYNRYTQSLSRTTGGMLLDAALFLFLRVLRNDRFFRIFLLIFHYIINLFLSGKKVNSARDPGHCRHEHRCLNPRKHRIHWYSVSVE